MRPLLFALLLLVPAACGNDAEGGTRPAPPGDTGDLLRGLTLDDGEKWPTDEHTRTAAAEMLRTIEASPEDLSAEELRALGERMQGQLDALIQGCTMEGPAHDALHVYLSALMPRIGTMANGEAAEARRAREEATAILRRFPEFFA